MYLFLCDTVTGKHEFDCRNLEATVSQESETTDSSVHHFTFSHISLVSGLLSCVSSPLLCQPVSDHSGRTLTLWLFDASCDLCTNSEHQFHAFSTLKQWFQKMGAMLSDMVRQGLTFRNDGHVTKRSLQLVWTHLDSPVDGVNDCVVDVLKGLIQLQEEEEEEVLKREGGEELRATEEDEQGSVVGLILPQVVNLPWNVRGRYALLTVLLPYVQLDQVSPLIGAVTFVIYHYLFTLIYIL